MVAVSKIDGDVVGLRIAEEASFKTLPGSPVWEPLEPNSFGQFGSSISRVARNPIRADRQMPKGTVSDVDASGNFQTDLLEGGAQDLMQAAFWADLRRKGEEAVTSVATGSDAYSVASTEGFQVGALILASGFAATANNGLKRVTSINANSSIEVAENLSDEASPPAGAKVVVVGHHFNSGEIDVDASGSQPRLIRSSGSISLSSLGISSGEWIYVGGDLPIERFSGSENGGFKRVRWTSNSQISLDKTASDMSSESGSGITLRVFFGRFLKNEADPSLIKRRTYQIERTLGASDDAQPTQIQAQYLVGAVPNEVSINIPTADKVTVDWSFLAADGETRTGAVGVKAGARPAIPGGNAWNTSSHLVRSRIALVDQFDEAPDPLFAYVTSLNLSISNNVTPAKAVGVLGAFELTSGKFEVSGSADVYFASVEAVEAVRANSDVTLDMILSERNRAIAIDIPLISLGGGLINVEEGSPVTVPLEISAAEATSVYSEMNHTASITFFDYVPNSAG